tara:strand:- start:285 stop:467 length:183 start_codon:yes stop_codon:yes gene_type:complete
MNIKTAQYFKDITGKVSSIQVTLVDKPNISVSVPLDPANTDYAEILKQVAAGTLTIKDAD